MHVVILEVGFIHCRLRGNGLVVIITDGVPFVTVLLTGHIARPIVAIVRFVELLSSPDRNRLAHVVALLMQFLIDGSLRQLVLVRLEKGENLWVAPGPRLSPFEDRTNFKHFLIAVVSSDDGPCAAGWTPVPRLV